MRNTMEQLSYSTGKPEEPQESCGWFWIRPRILQRLMSPKIFLFCVCIGTTMQGFIINGLINVSITSLERRFSLTSSQTGLIAGMYDISATLFSIPIAYFGGRAAASKPRWVGAGLIVMGAGSFVFSLPHFFTGQFTGSLTDGSSVCAARQSADCDPTSADSSVARYLYMFLAAQLLHGIGAAPLWSLAVAFIEANVQKKLVAMYLAIFYMTALIGPAFGYLGGSLLLNVHTEVGAVDIEQYNLSPNSEGWVGAWWLGFFVASFLTWMAALPVLAFPRSLPISKSLKTDTSETHGSKDTEQLAQVDDKLAAAKFSDLPASVWGCISNPTFLFMSLGGGTDGAVLAGLSTFMPKILQNQLSLPAAQAGLYTGAAALIGGATGTLFGGYLVKRLQLKVTGMIQLVAISAMVSMVFTLIFIVSCPNVRMAGISAAYPDTQRVVDGRSATVASYSSSLQSVCNSACGCTAADYQPICSPSGITFYSPCHAGCTVRGTQGYSGCSCVENSTASEVWLPEGKCSTNCSYLPYIVAAQIVVAFCMFMCTAPSSTTIVRSVSPRQRPLALGISTTVLRLVGTIPGPILYGMLIDRSCTLWFSDCGQTGACLLYDHWWMNRYVFIASIGFKLLSCIFFNLAWILYKPPMEASNVEVVKPTAVDEHQTNGVHSTDSTGTHNPAFEPEEFW